MKLRNCDRGQKSLFLFNFGITFQGQETGPERLISLRVTPRWALTTAPPPPLPSSLFLLSYTDAVVECSRKVGMVKAAGSWADFWHDFLTSFLMLGAYSPSYKAAELL